MINFAEITVDKCSGKDFKQSLKSKSWTLTSLSWEIVLKNKDWELVSRISAEIIFDLWASNWPIKDFLFKLYRDNSPFSYPSTIVHSPLDDL